jgi:hypothetical protein
MVDTGAKDIKGGQIIVSTRIAGDSLSLSSNDDARASASGTVVFIFQLPAIIGIRILLRSEFL